MIELKASNSLSFLRMGMKPCTMISKRKKELEMRMNFLMIPIFSLIELYRLITSLF